MRKDMKYLLGFTGICFLWFAALPELLNFSFPTGGWDWLVFIGTVGSVFFALYGIREQIKANNKSVMEQTDANNESIKKQTDANNESIKKQTDAKNKAILKQQQLSVVPCLDVDIYTPFITTAQNNAFRIFKEKDGKILNDGYTILRSKNKEYPDQFLPKINIKVKNKGLSTAFQVIVYLYELKKVDGLSSLNDIDKETILDFYDKISYENYKYYENINGNEKENQFDWIISPLYNLTIGNEEFNLVFDLSKITLKYHNILKFEYEDIYQNKYFQFMYLYFDNTQCHALPVSKLYNTDNPVE